MKIRDYNNFTGIKGGLLTFLTVGTMGWFPTLLSNGIFDVINNASEAILFLFIYVAICVLLFLFIGHKLISKKVKTNVFIVILCVVSMILLNGIMIYLYSYKILVSKDSLFVTIPVSLLVAIVCAEIWIRISNKVKNK